MSTKQKFVEPRPYADPEVAARKLVELANAFEAVQDGRIYIEKINEPFLYELKGTPEYKAGLKAGCASVTGFRHLRTAEYARTSLLCPREKASSRAAAGVGVARGAGARRSRRACGRLLPQNRPACPQRSVARRRTVILWILRSIPILALGVDHEPIRQFWQCLRIGPMADWAWYPGRAAATGMRTIPGAHRMRLTDPAAIVTASAKLHDLW